MMQFQCRWLSLAIPHLPSAYQIRPCSALALSTLIFQNSQGSLVFTYTTLYMSFLSELPCPVPTTFWPSLESLLVVSKGRMEGLCVKKASPLSVQYSSVPDASTVASFLPSLLLLQAFRERSGLPPGVQVRRAHQLMQTAWGEEARETQLFLRPSPSRNSGSQEYHLCWTVAIGISQAMKVLQCETFHVKRSRPELSRS